MSSSPDPRYGLVVPVKRPAIAKSRLRGLGDELRSALVVSFAADTVAAALAARSVAGVLAVTDDHELAGGLRDLGADVIPDGTSEDLNGSLVQAAAELHRRRPELRVAALCADLPCLRPEELDRALASGSGVAMSFVADAAGVGTTLLMAPTLDAFVPRFGHGSRNEHLAGGAEEIDLVDVPTLRRDVDTPEDLSDAMRLGVGPRTALVTTGLTLSAMQATVSSFDPATFSGEVLLDDGVALPFGADALRGSGLRLLRPGQRVRLETGDEDGTPVVRRMQIITLD